MDTKKDYIIKFSGLKTGDYTFKFCLDDDFFSGYENENLQRGSVIFDVVLKKREKFMTFEFDFSGTINSFCDRCLKPLDVPVSGKEALYVKFSDTEVSDDDNIAILPETEYQIDLSQFMYEYVATAMPMQNIHPNDENGNSTCDKTMLNILKSVAPDENPASDENKEDNPIWEKLKELKIQ